MTGTRLLLLASAATTLALIPICASAQTTPAEGLAPQQVQEAQSDGQSDVVVTARGRSEELQKSPAAITAFSAKEIDDARIKDVADFIGLTPNISIVKSQSAGNSFVTIRGISQVRNGESPVAVVTDGVQQISARQFTNDLFDVQQIEVLRGPQGALYGRNAIGGAIVITTKQPTNDIHVNADLSAGNGDDYRVEASLSGPLIRDKLLFRIAGSFRDFGGLLRNVYLNQTADFEQDRNIRGQLKALLSDTLTADLKASYSFTRAIGGQFQYQPAKFLPNSCFVDPANPFGGPAPDADRVSRDFCANNRGRNTRNLVDVSLKLQNVADWGTITSVTSYIGVTEFLGGDQFPYSASRNVFGVTDGTQTQYETDRSIQEDFRIASPVANRLQWMIGGYYLHTNRFISTTTGFDNGLGIVGVYRTPQYSNPTNPTLSFLADNNHNDAYAFYGSLSYKLTDTLEASAELRYDNDHRRQEISPQSSAGLPAGCTAANTGACVRTADFSKAQPKVTVRYTPSSELTVFADYGIGFRSGQYNQAGAAGLIGLPDLAKAESASTAEAGFKTSFLGGRLHVNATGYYTSDRNPFYFVFVGAVGAQILVNIDKVELYGGEVEVNFTPTKGLDLFGSYGYTHSAIKTFSFNPADIGRWAPYIPRDSGTVGAQYRFPITSGMNIFARGDLEHHGKQYWDPENATARSAFELINLRGGVETANGRLSLTGFVTNVTDKRYNAEFVSGGFVQPAEPRMYGIELSARF